MKHSPHNRKGVLLALTFIFCTSGFLQAETTVKDLRVEYLKNPVGIDADQPRFSWKMESDEQGAAQTAYEITVFSDEKSETKVWSSGKVESDKSVHIRYGGTLHPSTRYYWSVDVWDKNGKKVSSGETAFFETGLRDAGWSDAQWIKSIKDKTTADDVLEITDYSFEVDFKIQNIAAGFVFGYQDDNNFFMWQINLEKIPGKTCLRPHSWKGGNVESHEDKEISVNIVKGQKYTLRIEVSGSVAKTYIDGILIDTRTNPRGGNYGYGLIGFRMDKSQHTASGEEGYFDNVKVTSLDGKTIYFEEDFSDTDNFLFSHGEVKDGELYIMGFLDGPKAMQQKTPATKVYYDLEADVTIVNQNADIIFSARSKNHYYMWQINVEKPGTPKLRRHFYRGGSPSVTETNITELTGAEILNQELKLKIEVRDKVITTYLGGKKIDTYTDSESPTTAKGIGFRAHNDHLVNEIAYYDNVKLTEYANASQADPTVTLSEDFEGVGLTFEGYEPIIVNRNTKLKMYSPKDETRIFDESMGGIQMFRTKFNLSNKIKSARIYSSSLGVYDLFINGRRVGTPTGNDMIYDELKPGWTNYSKTVFYNTYDVTTLLAEGNNAMGALVSSGWWAGAVAKGEYGNPSLGFIAKLLIEYTDGTTEVIVTNTNSWTTSKEGAIRVGDIYDGEYYDARRESNWSSFDFDDSNWLPTIENKEFGGQITAFVGTNVQVRPELEQTPLSIIKYDGSTPDAKGYGMINIVEKKAGTDKLTLAKGDTAVYDMGQNMVGWIRFKVKGAAGTRVTFRFAEMLNDDGSKARVNDGPGGSLYRIILRSAKATLDYVLKGDPDGEEFCPSMTFFGFRYCDVVTNGDIEIEYLKGEVVGTVAEEGSSLETSHDVVNKFYQNVMWGQRGNFLSVPTDCPQRDERLGWTGDILAFGRAATYNADLAGFFEKWLGDVRDSQREDGAYYDLSPRVWGNEVGNAAWAEAGLVIPWTTYLMYGNTGVLEDSYASMEKFMTQRATQIFDGYKYNGGGTQHGDWLHPDGAQYQTDKRYIAVCFYAYSAQLMEKMSTVLSKEENDAYAGKTKAYKELYDNIKAEFQTRYVNADGSLKQTTQTAYLLALKLDLFPNDDAKNKGITYLNNLIANNGNKLGTGFVGTAIINQTLSDIGSTDMAYNLLLQRSNPSWLYSLDQGATTVWERWDGYTKEKGFRNNTEMNSFNHYAYGAVSEWMYRYMAGINPDEANPGFKHILITPHPDRRTSFPAGQERITAVDATHNSYYGKIRSAWAIDKQERITYQVSIPANTTATVALNVLSAEDDILVNGVNAGNAEGVISLKRTQDNVYIEIGSGSYTFTTTNKTGLESINSREANWSLYPNPVKDVLSIQGNEEADSVRIYNLAGSLMYAQHNSQPINMMGFPGGVYMVQVKAANEINNWKVIKE